MSYFFPLVLFLLGLQAFAAEGTKVYPRPTETEIKAKLSPMQFEVTQKSGTEPPFKNDFWNNHEDGIYVDVVSGEPLFSSRDKYESGTGWPSFTRPIDQNYIVLKEDNTLFQKRTEVRSKYGNSHLGHVFHDGPAPTGLRYCMNSAALRFVPASALGTSGYGEFETVFASKNPGSQGETKQATATFAGGCFWCMVPPFAPDKVAGIFSTVSGYMGGTEKNPSYELVSSGTTNYVESVQITFDPRVISFDQLLTIFWRNIDPTQEDGQFCDHGKQYRSVIFYADEAQKSAAEASLQKIIKDAKLKKVYTQMIDARPFTFYPAEDYHQDYYKKNPYRYKFYRWNCGRDQRLKEVWGSSPH